MVAWLACIAGLLRPRFDDRRTPATTARAVRRSRRNRSPEQADQLGHVVEFLEVPRRPRRRRDLLLRRRRGSGGGAVGELPPEVVPRQGGLWVARYGGAYLDEPATVARHDLHAPG